MDLVGTEKSQIAVLKKMYQKSIEDIEVLKLQLEMDRLRRERVEKTLKEKLNLFEKCLEYSMSPMAILDHRFDFIRVNKAYAAADGKKVSDFPGHNHFEFYPSNAKEIFENVLKTKEPYIVSQRAFTYQEHPQRGVTFWDWVLAPVLDQENEVKYLILSLQDVTEKVRKTEELNYFFDLSLDGFLVVGFDGFIKRMNKAYGDIFDFREDTALERPFLKLLKPRIHHDDYKISERMFEKMLSGFMVKGFENRCSTKNGEYRWLSWKGIPCPERKIVFIVVRDICELQMNELRLETLLKLSQMDEASLPDLVTFALREGVRLTSSCIGWVGILNEDQSEAVFLLWEEKKCGQYTIRINDETLFPIPGVGSFWEVVRSRRPLIIKEPDISQSVNIEGISDPIHNRIVVPVFEGRQIVMVGGVANKNGHYHKVDIKQFTLLLSGIWKVVQKHHMEQKLEQSEARFCKVFELNPSGMTLKRLDTGEYIEVNKNFEVITGFSREEVIGRPAYELNIVKREQLVDVLKQVKETGFCRNREMNIVTKSGEVKTIISSMEVFELKGEKLIINVFEDITERKQMEKEMARLDRLNTIGEMAAGISHEIRNPLSVVGGFLQLLSEKEECRSYRGEFSLMLEELNRANSIISEFLSLARNKPMSQEMHDLNSIIQNLFALLQADAMIDDKNIVLELGDIPNLLLDEKEVRQLILNLCRNGLEAMSSGGILKIKTLYVDGGVLLGISDQGPGIEPEIIPKIGTPFFTTKDQGTGLGLAICYSIAARHNASISIDTGSQGTTFWVQFKLI